MKQLKVSVYLLLQALLSLLLPIFYFLSFSVSRQGDMVTARVTFNPIWLMGLVLAAILATFVLRRRRERYDEYARRAVQLADAICFKAALIFLGAILLPALFAMTVFASPVITSADIIRCGRILVWGFFGLFLLRAGLFWWIDKKGMVR